MLPYAQAVEQEKMACFVVEPGGEPAVIVINPRSEDKTSVVETLLPAMMRGKGAGQKCLARCRRVKPRTMNKTNKAGAILG